MAIIPRMTSSDDQQHHSHAEAFVNSSAYGFCVFELDSLADIRTDLLECAKELEARQWTLRGTILLAPEGVNIRLSGHPMAVQAMQHKLRSLHAALGDMEFKDSLSERATLSRFLVKLKKEVISMGMSNVQPAVHGLAAHVSAEEFKSWLDTDKDMVVLDTRNDYEVRLGTFEKARVLPNLKSFRAFPKQVKQELQDVPKDKPIVMFCTGGVRCEKASFVLQQDGFQHVYQLDGGILKYFERVGGAHYRGDCYIFDDRVALQPDLTEGPAIACYTCRSPLTVEDQASSDFEPGRHCPHCKHGKSDFRHCA